jgi:hypothetical protein
VITDVIMPGGKSGVDLAVILARERPELPMPNTDFHALPLQSALGRSICDSSLLLNFSIRGDAEAGNALRFRRFLRP